jgi:hypothetical protein
MADMQQMKYKNSFDSVFCIRILFFNLFGFLPQSGQLEKHGENQRKQKKTFFSVFGFLLPNGQ